MPVTWVEDVRLCHVGGDASVTDDSATPRHRDDTVTGQAHDAARASVWVCLHEVTLVAVGDAPCLLHGYDTAPVMLDRRVCCARYTWTEGVCACRSKHAG